MKERSKGERKYIDTIFLLLAVCFIFLTLNSVPSTIYAEDDFTIKLKSRYFIPAEDKSSFIQSKLPVAPRERVHVIIQFFELPDAAMKEALETKGIELLAYLPNKAWFASIPKGI